jgi:hypothetical protein
LAFMTSFLHLVARLIPYLSRYQPGPALNRNPRVEKK